MPDSQDDDILIPDFASHLIPACEDPADLARLELFQGFAEAWEFQQGSRRGYQGWENAACRGDPGG
jgi:hypothetical protein